MHTTTRTEQRTSRKTTTTGRTARPGKTPEERAAEVEALAAQLTAAVAELTTSEAWLGMLGVAARFTRYSSGRSGLFVVRECCRGRREARRLLGAVLVLDQLEEDVFGVAAPGCREPPQLRYVLLLGGQFDQHIDGVGVASVGESAQLGAIAALCRELDQLVLGVAVTASGSLTQPDEVVDHGMLPPVIDQNIGPARTPVHPSMAGCHGRFGAGRPLG